MKNKLILVGLILSCLFLLTTCDNAFGDYDNPVDTEADNYQGYKTEDIPVTGVTISPTNLSLYVGGDEKNLTATIAPSSTIHKSVTWSSSNTDVATVSSEGVVTPVAAGTATITVKTQNNCYTNHELAVSPESERASASA